ncbi:hypothetical protein SAMN06265371_1106 [Lutibacter agarilyticus]|uniref:DUF4136 domain-containing protein n=1 Tax=Lutibacter agarilyticus TaxID=1109740 RepID=A0A238YN97_9FLAO|nr:hypothetical protein [Lutibacter agarilyticus]SNR72104.1 hypothetical protein SAMN06265371_1106 [Lutibacter agarilyticus]
MKNWVIIFVFFILLSCSSTRINESWRNPEYVNYQPSKVLILGITPNLTARKIYEEKLKLAFIHKGVMANEGTTIFKRSFTNLKQTEEDIEEQIDTLLEKGYDAILISAVKGYENRITYRGELLRNDIRFNRFGPYYYLHQDVYFDDEIYQEYKVYHIEISLYDLKSKTEKSLVWVASYDIIDPKKIKATIKDCVDAIVSSLEEEGILPLN